MGSRAIPALANGGISNWPHIDGAWQINRDGSVSPEQMPHNTSLQTDTNMYEGWRISRWESSVVDQNRLRMVSLTDDNLELVLLLESPQMPDRQRWQVRFRQYAGYRNIDEAYRLGLWQWLDDSDQRCGFTFTVQESPQFASWAADYLHAVAPEVRHYVIATEDDVVEVLAAVEPIWEAADPAQPDSPLPGKAKHLYIGEDDAEIERLVVDLRDRNRE